MQSGDPDRRIVEGATVAVTGFPPLVESIHCRLEFGAQGVLVGARAATDSSSYRTVAEVSYADAGWLRIGGRGALTATSGTRWFGGGFGAQGILEGAAFATVMNSLTTRTETTIETFIQFNAGRREVLIRNSEITPQVLQVRLAPVFARLDARTAVASGRTPLGDGNQARLDLLKQLGELRASGVLTEAEFIAEKDRILHG